MANGTGWALGLFGAGIIVGAVGSRSTPAAAPVPWENFSTEVGSAAPRSGIGTVESLELWVVVVTLAAGALIALIVALMLIDRRHQADRTSRRGAFLAGPPSRWRGVVLPATPSTRSGPAPRRTASGRSGTR